MNTKPLVHPIPDGQPLPGEQPAPVEQPRRRTFIQPTFTGRFKRITAPKLAAVTVALTLGVASVQAQTHPFPDPPPAPGVQPQPINPDDHRLQRMATPQQPITPQPRANDAWVLFDDRVGKDLGLQADALQRLRDVDGRYQKEYGGLGSAPHTNPGYKDLNDRRNRDVREILTQAQFQDWERMQNGTRERMDRMNNGTERDGGMKGVPTTPRIKATDTTLKTAPPAPQKKQ